MHLASLKNKRKIQKKKQLILPQMFCYIFIYYFYYIIIIYSINIKTTLLWLLLLF